MKVLMLAVVLFAASCSASSPLQVAEPTPAVPETVVATTPTPTVPAPEPPDISLFNAAGNNEFIRPFDERAPAPMGATAAFSIDSYFEPGEVEDLDAAAEQAKQDDQVVVAIDLVGCVLMSVWALPQPDQVLAGYEWADVDCAVAVEYHVLFLIDAVGSNPEGDWNYSDTAPAVKLEEQRIGSR